MGRARPGSRCPPTSPTGRNAATSSTTVPASRATASGTGRGGSSRPPGGARADPGPPGLLGPGRRWPRRAGTAAWGSGERAADSAPAAARGWVPHASWSARGWAHAAASCDRAAAGAASVRSTAAAAAAAGSRARGSSAAATSPALS